MFIVRRRNSKVVPRYKSALAWESRAEQSSPQEASSVTGQTSGWAQNRVLAGSQHPVFGTVELLDSGVM